MDNKNTTVKIQVHKKNKTTHQTLGVHEFLISILINVNCHEALIPKALLMKANILKFILELNEKQKKYPI